MIGTLQAVSSQFLESTAQQQSLSPQDINFKDTLSEAMVGINELQQTAGASTEMFVKGEITDLHKVMLDVQKARVGLELMLNIRNKLIEGYQEIMRMQI